MAYLMKELHGDDVDFIFMDTGAEHPKTYEFLRKCDKHFDLNLTCLRGDFNQERGKGHTYTLTSIQDVGPDNAPFAAMMRKYGTPTVNGAWCTSRMKQEIHDKYCDDMYGKGGYATWIGIRADEPRRLGRLGQDPAIRFLAEISDATKNDILTWWAKQPFDLEIPEHLGNCVFCIKKSIAKLVQATKDEPELAAKFMECVSQADDREDLNRGFPKEVMYRGRNSLQSLQGLGQIASQEYLDRMTDVNHACKESCEVFDLGVQTTMFDDDEITEE